MAHLNDHDRWTAACHHEAAHCAVAMTLGVPIVDVILAWARRRPDGLVRIPDAFTDPRPLALVAGAGALGEARWVQLTHGTALRSAYKVAERLNTDDAAALDG